MGEQILKNDLLSIEKSPVTAWELEGSPSVYESDFNGLLKERLLRYFKALPYSLKQKLLLPGELVIRRFGTQFREAHLHTHLPLEYLP
jgi:hypothetical protein